MKENLKLGLILLIVTAIAGVLLGVANTVTKEPIAKQAEKKKQLALAEVMSSAETFENVDADITEDSTIVEVNKGIKGSDVVGYAIKVVPKGYGGPIEMMVGIGSDGKLGGIKILSLQETPGLGANAPKPQFSGQFKGKPADKALEVVKTGAANENEVDAITGATITSKAVTDGVNEAIEFYNSHLKGGVK